jgi:hypothetical protein
METVSYQVVIHNFCLKIWKYYTLREGEAITKACCVYWVS